MINQPIKGRSGCSELELKMSDCYFNKRRKKTKESGFWSLPEAVALSCLAKVSRLDHAALSLVSKSYRSLVASPELCRTRWLVGCTEASFYVCLRIYPDPSPRWFILTHNRRLSPIPSNPYQAPHSSSFVVVDSGIYVIGGIIRGNRTWDVSFLDCFSHTWRRVPPMKMARASASASLVDGKIYVFGGFDDDSNYSTWAEVFDPKTQVWEPLIRDIETHHLNKIIYQSVVIQGKKIYALDENDQSFTILPSGCTFSTSVGKIDCKIGYRKDWCVIDKLLFSCATRRRIVWCDPDVFGWKMVKGLEELHSLLFGYRHIIHNDGMQGTPTRIGFRYEIIKLCTNAAGNIVIFWIAQLEDPESLELWSAEISVEIRHERREVWGEIVRSGAVFKLDPLSLSYGFNVLFSASVYV